MLTAPIFISVFWAIFLVYWIVSAFNTKRYARRGLMSWGVRLLILLVISAIDSLPGIHSFFLGVQYSLVVQWIGVVLCGAGVSFAIWARMHLGRNWGMPMSLKEEAELVTSGPYAYVRHPIYTGFILAGLGSSLVTVWWVPPFIVLSAYFVYAGKREEMSMQNEFPNRYPEYMKRTKMLIPFVF
ncbi:MAG: isoprenylcysteine carboxylmethyltransferase family protein [Candidatus Pacebacteria bacterium]|nr:isoprenylcysteine carboxylmethyltransferase family protein [Candidatus Paceibacterota bacterium]